MLPTLQPIEPRAGTEGTLQVVQQHAEGMAIPVPLTATDSMKDSQVVATRTAEAGGPVREVEFEVAIVICLPAPFSELPLPDR